MNGQLTVSRKSAAVLNIVNDSRAGTRDHSDSDGIVSYGAHSGGVLKTYGVAHFRGEPTNMPLDQYGIWGVKNLGRDQRMQARLSSRKRYAFRLGRGQVNQT